MKKQIAVALTLLLSYPIFTSKAEITTTEHPIIYSEDIREMILYANQNEKNEPAIIDAFCSDIDLNKYSYEQLISWRDLSKTETLSKYLSQITTRKEIEILNEIRSLTTEELVSYTSVFPKRKAIATQYIEQILLPNIKELSLPELIYFDDYLDAKYHDQILEEINTRPNEINDILKQNRTAYNNFEAEFSYKLKYIIEKTLWTYFVEGHKELNKAYAQIGIVPDDAFSAANQYQRLVNACFPTKRIRETLQNEVDKYCSEINKARQEYSRVAGEKTYVKVSYKVPEFNLNSNVPYTPLLKISKARQEYIQSREEVSTGTSVIGWIFGGVAGLIAKGIGDWLAVDDLVSAEFSARKSYMEDVQERLISSFASYSNTVITGIDNAL